ncbi:hypothetical protein VP01_1160g1 [Puccinia sorghi]|uniref:Uncharacterized protein n=1 Tax=Puccinia sorghi TaxID=27349 RepID=A0A0L6VRH0_9BASI|nr:hypothetical protein VP01_1160g1 [Puccinia sorghi]
MIDPETTETTNVVVDSLRSLCRTSNVSFAARAGKNAGGCPSPNEIEQRKALLLQIRTSLLPDLRTQISELLISLNISNLDIEPSPKLLATLAVIRKLEHTLDQLKFATESIAVKPPQLPDHDDHHHGHLKQFRSSRLLLKMINLMEHNICELFRHCIVFLEAWNSSDGDHHLPSTILRPATNPIDSRKAVILTTALSCRTIQELIEWLQLDELGMLDHEWRQHVDLLNSHLAMLITRINLPLPLEKNPHRSDQDYNQSDSSHHDGNNKTHRDQSPSPFKADRNQNEDANTSEHQKRPSTSGPNIDQAQNRSENIPTADGTETQHSNNKGEESEAHDGSGDSETDGSGSSYSSGQSEEIPIRRAVVTLAKEMITITKLTRIFFTKLSRRRTSKAPYKLDSEMSSRELCLLADGVSAVGVVVNNVLALLVQIYDEDDLDETELSQIKKNAYSISERFNSALLLLAFFLVPNDHQLQESPSLPSGPNHFSSWFHQFRKSASNAFTVHWAMHQFQETLFQ